MTPGRISRRVVTDRLGTTRERLQDILAKGFGEGVSEYTEIATGLGRHNALSADDTTLLRTLAGYRNRMVHFYHEVSAEELFGICTEQLSDLDHLSGVLADWIRENSDQVDPNL